jgi:hypothetical protein
LRQFLLYYFVEEEFLSTVCCGKITDISWE